MCLGCMSFGGAKGIGWDWTLGYPEAKRVIDKAVDLGVNFFDTAHVYSRGKSEEIVGRALQGRRADVVIATKVGLPFSEALDDRGLGRKHIRLSIEKSLQRLKTDYVDLYQIHRWDYETPIEDVLRTLHDLAHNERVVDHIGASSMWGLQFAKSLSSSESHGFERFVTMQNH